MLFQAVSREGVLGTLKDTNERLPQRKEQCYATPERVEKREQVFLRNPMNNKKKVYRIGEGATGPGNRILSSRKKGKLPKHNEVPHSIDRSTYEQSIPRISGPPPKKNAQSRKCKKGYIYSTERRDTETESQQSNKNIQNSKCTNEI